MLVRILLVFMALILLYVRHQVDNKAESQGNSQQIAVRIIASAQV